MTYAKQTSIFDYKPHFDGSDIVQERDGARLTGQIQRVYDAMKSGRWLTLESLVDLTGDPACSISAQIRNLRKRRFGSHTIEKRYFIDGLYEYRLVS